MNTPEFKRLLKIFADHPDDVDLSKNEAVVQVQNQVIAFKAFNREGSMWVEEGGVSSSAESWIAERIANLPLLAQRIIDYTDDADIFVTPTGYYIDQIENNPNDEERYIADALQQLESSVSYGAGFASLVVYLTAEAGEGKTTLINRLAKQQASQYLAKKTRRLIVPVQLGGRSFLRLDDMIIGSVANNYKFRGLYIDSFLELVKYGFVVPAFDGFEEMFVVGSSGEAVSSLGNLLANLNSMGLLIVSARTAYFEIRDFESQARLFDGIRDGAASFARLKLQRWNEAQFVSYWNERGRSKPQETFDALAHKLGSSSHPLLTRAVLVRRLADIADNAPRFDRLLQKINTASASYFAELVDSILEREIESKWVDRAEENVHRPLLTIKQHHELLSLLAVEMAVTMSGQLGFDEVTLVAELFCDSQKLVPQVTRQVLARIFDHPLLTKPEGKANVSSFDHEEFRDFFLGEAIGNFILSRNVGEFQRTLRKSVYPSSVIDACTSFLKMHNANIRDAVIFIQTSISIENAASYAKETGTKIILQLLQQTQGIECTILDSYISSEAFSGLQISNVVFEKCFCHDAVFRACKLINCKFLECEFDGVELHDDARFSDTIFSKCVIYNVRLNNDDDKTYFDPYGIHKCLSAAGITLELPAEDKVVAIESNEHDDRLALANRALRGFQRCTGINESTMRKRLGKRASEFEEKVLNDLLDVGILGFEPYHGSGVDRRFRLTTKMTQLENALRKSKGSFDNFLNFFKEE